MAELNVPIYDFRHGVLTPKLKDRPNLDLYKSGVQVGQNFLTQIHGPTQYRPGFIHSRTTRRNNVAHFIPFTFADDEAYILSFTEGYMRIFTDGGVVTEDPFAISGITQANPGVITAVGHDYVDGDEVYIDNCVGMTDLNGQFFLVTGTVTPGVSERNWPYSVPGNYTYNGSDIEVTAGKAILKLSGAATNYPFTTPGNYTYNGVVIQVIGGEAKLIDTGGDLLTGLEGYWKMDAASWSGLPGDVLDSSLNTNNGQAINDAQTVGGGIIDRCGTFDGVDDSISIPNHASLSFEIDEAFSYQVWVKTGSSSTQAIMAKQQVAGSFGINLQMGVTGILRMNLVGSTGSLAVDMTNTVNNDVWRHVVVTYDGSEVAAGVKLYLDGSLETPAVIADILSGTIVTTVPFRLGNRENADQDFDGLLDEAVVWSKELTQAQVTILYNSGAAQALDYYSTDDPTIVNNTGAVFASPLNAFTETSTKPAGSAIQYQVSSDDGTTFEYWDGAAWAAASDNTTQEIASAVATIAGTYISGNLASIQILDASTYVVNETGGAPPNLEVEIDFANLTGPPDQFTFHGYYDGSPPHIVDVDIWNYQTTTWDTLGQIPDDPTATITQYNFPVGGTKSDYISSGAAKIRINHTSVGTPGDTLAIDYVYLLTTPTDSGHYDFQSNSAATIQTNIGTLAGSGTFKFKGFLHSVNGEETPILDNILVGNISYPITNPTIESDDGFPFTVALEDFTETATKPANTELQYIVSIDDGVNYLWWGGAAWVASNGTYAESNTAAVVDTNIAALGASGTFKYKAFLHTSDFLVTPELDNIHTQFTVLPSANFEITDQDGNPIDTSGFDAYIGSGTVARVYEINSPYLEADLPQLKFGQKADIMYIDHPSYAPRKLTRFGDGTWTLAPYSRTNDPFGQTDITAITQANPGQVTTAANHGFETGDDVLIENVGGMLQVNHVVFTVTKINDTVYTIGVDTTAYDAYTSGGICLLDGAAPATVGFYGGRVFHGGSLNDPDILAGSRSPDPTTGATRYEDFTVGSDATNAVLYALTSASTSSVDRVRFFLGTRQFLATGTYAGMLKVNGGSDAIPISGIAIESFPVDNFGVADIMPVNFGTDIIYVQRGSEVVYSFKYTLLNDGWKSDDETIQSDELPHGGIKQITYQQGNPNQIWAVMNDGRLLSFVYSDGEGVSAWNEHATGGEGIILTVAAQPQEDNRDRVWIAVERTINGVTRRYVEYLAKNPRIPERDDFYTGSSATDQDTDDLTFRNLMFYAQKRQVHLDSALSLDTTQTVTITPAAVTGSNISFTASESIFSAGDLLRRIQIKYNDGDEMGIAEITSYVSETEVKCKILQDFASTDPITSGNWYFTQDVVEGLDHLEGETVSILTDGGIHPDRVVSNGAITLQSQATYVIVGLFYYGRVKTMPLELLLSTGITPGKFKSVNKINLMFRNTLGISYGTDPYNMQKIAFRSGVQYTDRPPLLFSGVQEHPGFDNYGEQRAMWVVQTMPYPCTLNSLVMDMEFSEEN
ncbi:MAG: hypothetical protein KAU50_04390 [Candidatus Marinimicrobia bacterium]|nr:hypothetical protein [Candidatus Neomarinimicrobiota bacterium]